MKEWRLYTRRPPWTDGRRRSCSTCGKPAKVFHPDRLYTAYCEDHGRHLVVEAAAP